MKFKLGQIQEMKEPLSRLVEQSLPLKLAFKLNKLVKAIDENLTVIEEERVKLVKKLGVLNEKTQNIEIPKDAMAQFQKEFIELMHEDVEIEFDAFNINDFETKDRVIEITTQDMLKLESIFEE